jgi:CspA family cold shock protein
LKRITKDEYIKKMAEGFPATRTRHGFYCAERRPVVFKSQVQERPKQQDLMTGTVKRFGGTYGYITGENGLDYFVHYSGIFATGFRTLSPGQRVEFEPMESEKGPYAINVNVLG